MTSIDVHSSPDGGVVLEVVPRLGARFHRLRIRGVDVLRTPPNVETQEADPFYWGAFPMVPWCNRIPDGRIVWDGVDVTVPLNFGRHAIHGEGYETAWDVVESGHYRFRGPGIFPWRYRSDVVVGVRDDGISWSISVTNEDDVPIPAGVGYHPWFTADGGLRVAVPATDVYEATDDALAVGPPRPVSGDTDLRSLAPVPWGLDRVYTGLTASSLLLRWDESDLSLAFGWNDAADHVVVAAFEEVGAVAVEPQTQCGDAIGRLARGEAGAAHVLAPGETLKLDYDLRIVETPR